MKKYRLTILLFVTIFVNFNLIAQQSNRLVLMEWQTSTGCGSCTYHHDRIDSLVQNNPGKLMLLEYHGDFGAFDDPFYHQNFIDHLYRRYIYDWTGYPDATIDGNYYCGHPTNIDQTMIDSRAAVPSPFEITLDHSIDNSGQININAIIKASDTISGNLFANIAVVEKKIPFDLAFINGLQEYHYVLRKLIPDKYGTLLPSSFMPGDSVVINETALLENIYDYGEVAVVGFVQDTSSLEIHQAAFSQPELPVSMDFNIPDSIYSIATNPLDTASFDTEFTITSDSAGDYKLKIIDSLPAGWTSSFKIGQNVYSDSAVVSMGTNEIKTIEVNIITGNSENEGGFVRLKANPINRFSFYEKEQKFYAFSNTETFIVSKYFRFNNIDELITGDIDAISYPYLFSDFHAFKGFGPNGPNENHINNLIIESQGKNVFTGLSDFNVRQINNYLDMGGNLLYISENAGKVNENSSGYYDISPFYDSFYHNTLGINQFIDYTYLGIGSHTLSTHPQENNNLFNLPLINISGTTGKLEYFEHKDFMKPVLIYNQDSLKPIAVRRKDTTNKSKLMYLAIDYEGNDNSSFRSTFLEQTIDWFNDNYYLSKSRFDDNSLVIYPNPVKNRIIINSPEAISGVEIYDSRGVKVLDKNYSSQKEISLEIKEIQSGIYILKTYFDEKSFPEQKKIIIK